MTHHPTYAALLRVVEAVRDNLSACHQDVYEALMALDADPGFTPEDVARSLCNNRAAYNLFRFNAAADPVPREDREAAREAMRAIGVPEDEHGI